MRRLLLATHMLAATVVAAPVPSWQTIGTGMSQAKLTQEETLLYEHNSTADTAYLNHFWTAGSPGVDYATFRYYVDGEQTPSIVFIPSLACGVGFDDQTAPWGTRWLGKGANATGWFHNIQVPFKSLRITFQKRSGDKNGVIWTIVRGIENAPLRVGALELPTAARLQLQVTERTLRPLEFVDVARVPAPKSGVVFLHSMAVASGNWNFMEGCYHLFAPAASAPWPGQLLSTGMEDYYDSAFYFNGGNFHAPVSGSTHKRRRTAKEGGGTEWSGYRVHEMDPLAFSGGGAIMRWRNGDVTDEATGLKCTLETGGKTVGEPTSSNVSAYAWVYVW